MLTHGEVHANVPAADLQRARRFYVDKLGLTPVAEDEWSLRFPTPSGSWFQVYATSYAGTGKHTIAQWDVEDLPAAVAQLSQVGVSFEHYDLPGVTWDGDIADLGGQRAAWFTDSEGNVLCLDERPPG
ncbi:Catechol 2,3-dioxygenase [Friedmanniella luteola]|uniref:Catechol 2,3-dioxygenase n=1 Tax=Friedmanniella luteola TaxID=546871 RepID=A0A1H2A7N7_9ACTN|nr:VOC family protein [Friedmanniella luteola]SDT42001.1 Catechol 2,3-dioxygenase [Friedmanniella luteola]